MIGASLVLWRANHRCSFVQSRKRGPDRLIISEICYKLLKKTMRCLKETLLSFLAIQTCGPNLHRPRQQKVRSGGAGVADAMYTPQAGSTYRLRLSSKRGAIPLRSSAPCWATSHFYRTSFGEEVWTAILEKTQHDSKWVCRYGSCWACSPRDDCFGCLTSGPMGWV